ncbi:hypothetical protein [Thermus phage P23-45]|nr:hypothetical protein [Thermus phage P23-45]
MYDERLVDGVTYISFARVKDADIKRMVGKLSVGHLVNLAYANPEVFAVFCLYQAWVLLPKDDEGFVPLPAALEKAKEVAESFLKGGNL